MTPDEQELLEQYLAHLNVLGDEGEYPDFEAWYQEVRYAQGPRRPVHPAEGLRDTLRGQPGRRPGLQPVAATSIRRAAMPFVKRLNAPSLCPANKPRSRNY